LQGSFDTYFPANREYLVPNLVAMPFTGGNANRATTYLVYAGLLAMATYLLAIAVGIERGAAVVGGMLVPLLTMPVFVGGPPLLYPIYQLNPHIAQSVALMLLMLACFWSLEQRKGASKVVTVFVPALLTVWASLSLISLTVLMVPPLAILGLASLFSRPERRWIVPRVASALLAILVPMALGMVRYIYGLSAYTAYAFFSSDFGQFRGNLTYASIIYLPGLGALLVAGGIAGALYALIVGGRRLRTFAVGYLVLMGAFQVIAYATEVWITTYQGPAPIYFEIFLWPLSAMFCGYLGFAVIAAIARGATHLPGRGGSVVPGIILHAGLAALTLYLVFSNFPALARGPAKACSDGSFAHLRPTPITERLAAEIGLQPGALYRGSVASFTGFQNRPSVNWIELNGYDAQLYNATGNDHRTIGLWKYNIPTLFQYNTYLTPQYYVLFSALLDRPQDKQIRSIVFLTKPDERILKLWGVRFLITDFDPGFGTVRMEMPISQHAPLRLIELSDANIGNYSPTKVERVDDFAAALAALRRADFDGRQVVVALSALAQPLVPATEAHMTLTRGGFVLKAQSTARSILVLPVQYSHCWTATGKGNPQLFRANFAQLGVAFKGTLDSSLVFRYGPILAGRCRLEDLADMDRFNIRAVARAKAGAP